MKTCIRVAASTAAALVIAAAMPLLGQQEQQSPLGYDDTPMQPGGKWHVHDAKRPQPRVITPGPAPAPAAAPSDATVLLGTGADLNAWQMMEGGGAVTWPMKD